MTTWLREVIDDARRRYAEGKLPLSEYAEREIARIRRDSERRMEPVREVTDTAANQVEHVDVAGAPGRSTSK